MARVGLIRAATTMAWESPRDGPPQCDGPTLSQRVMERPIAPRDQQCTIPPTRSCTKVKLAVAKPPQCRSILLKFYVIGDVRPVSRESLFICLKLARPSIRIHQCTRRLFRGGLLLHTAQK